jgi:hypothetical protein
MSATNDAIAKTIEPILGRIKNMKKAETSNTINPGTNNSI